MSFVLQLLKHFSLKISDRTSQTPWQVLQRLCYLQILLRLGQLYTQTVHSLLWWHCWWSIGRIFWHMPMWSAYTNGIKFTRGLAAIVHNMSLLVKGHMKQNSLIVTYQLKTQTEYNLDQGFLTGAMYEGAFQFTWDKKK